MTLLPRPRSARRHQRGSTFIEYALLLGLFAAAATAAINVLNDSSGKKVGEVAANVGDPPKVLGSMPATTTGGGGGGGATTTAPPSTTTTTTAAPTTTTSTTTTTAAPTTTTSTTTTTIQCTATAVSPLTASSTAGANNRITATSFSVTVNSACHGTSLSMNVNGNSWPLSPDDSTSRSTGSLSNAQRNGFPAGSYTVTTSGAQGSFTLVVN